MKRGMWFPMFRAMAKVPGLGLKGHTESPRARTASMLEAKRDHASLQAHTKDETREFRASIRAKKSLACSPPGYVTVSNTMASNTQSGHDPAELGELERSILSIIWRLGKVTAEQVREDLDRGLKDSTVRTVLRRLEEKGYVAHSVEDRTFIYRPAESRQRVAGRAVKRIVDWFCEGSVEALLVGMVDSKVLDRAELRRLAEHIAAAQKAAPSPKKEA
jgi:BlaI family transcriptional regulator, penicillinase repressor